MFVHRNSLSILIFMTFYLMGCMDRNDEQAGRNETHHADHITALNYIEQGELYNAEAVIPPQCYTKTEGVNNPCYICHQSYDEKHRPNQMRDGTLQGAYAFSDVGVSNSWTNLFVDRTESIEKISDSVMHKYVSQDNYTDLIKWMKSDAWSGEVTEIKDLALGAAAFDENGLALDGSRWVAFNYKPLPSTFWPTNGSTDDVMIRLPRIFSELNGQFNRDVYYANLALVELALKDETRTSQIPLNEQIIGVDLNGDSILSQSVQTVFSRTHYVGDAKSIQVSYMLYPEGTEFLHSVRYLGMNENGEIFNAKRMKELRYMRKATHMENARINQTYYREAKEKALENLPSTVDFADRGMSNGFGWLLWGFIEDKQGKLRKQSHEEQFFCMGCHKSIGSTLDQTFSFPRKLAGAEGWGYIDLKKLKDVPNRGESLGEYATYMQRVNGGDEFRQNSEMLSKWFQNGKLNIEKVTAQPSIYSLIAPSPERAAKLNKAYMTIVNEQSFLFGRDAVVKEAVNILKEVDESQPPLKPEFQYQWDIRLDWDAGSSTLAADTVLN